MPLVSVIILNWNGKEFLDVCLKSIADVGYRPLETIVVDNASTDDSVSYIRRAYPWVKVIENRQNVGFARGNNIGFRKSRGKYILFLNNDTRLPRGFFEPLVSLLEKDNTIGCVQPQIRLLREPHLLDQVGSYLTCTGFLYHYGFRKPWKRDIYQKTCDIFSAKGACMLVRRSAMEKVGGFDDDYFIFFEETDLCHRMWLSGYRVVYEPVSHMYHVAGGDTSDTYAYERRLYLSMRNMVFTYLKNFGLWNMIRVFPVLVVMHGFLFFYFLLRFRLDLASAMIRAYWWNISHLQFLLKKRKRIQSRRVLSDAVLNKKILRNPRAEYYYYLLTRLERYEDT